MLRFASVRIDWMKFSIKFIRPTTPMVLSREIPLHISSAAAASHSAWKMKISHFAAVHWIVEIFDLSRVQHLIHLISSFMGGLHECSVKVDQRLSLLLLLMSENGCVKGYRHRRVKKTNSSFWHDKTAHYFTHSMDEFYLPSPLGWFKLYLKWLGRRRWELETSRKLLFFSGSLDSVVVLSVHSGNSSEQW